MHIQSVSPARSARWGARAAGRPAPAGEREGRGNIGHRRGAGAAAGPVSRRVLAVLLCARSHNVVYTHSHHSLYTDR